MRNKSYSKRIEDAQVMLSGVTQYKDNLSDRGINDEYIDKFKTLVELCVTLNNDQEQMKGTLKDLTQRFIDNMNSLDKEVQFCKRGIMINMPKTLWKAFGFLFRERKPKTESEPENPPDDPPNDPPDDTLNAATDNAIGYVNTVKPANVQPKKSRKNRKRRNKRR